jgi:hypothetical protein
VALWISSSNRSFTSNFTTESTRARRALTRAASTSSGIDVDAHAVRAVFSGGGDDDRAIAGAQVIDGVVLGNAGEFEHGVHDDIRCANKGGVRRTLLFGLAVLGGGARDDNQGGGQLMESHVNLPFVG